MSEAWEFEIYVYQDEHETAKKAHYSPQGLPLCESLGDHLSSIKRRKYSLLIVFSANVRGKWILGALDIRWKHDE